MADGLHTAAASLAETLRYAVHHFKVGACRAGRDAERLDIGESLLGAIAPRPETPHAAPRRPELVPCERLQCGGKDSRNDATGAA